MEKELKLREESSSNNKNVLSPCNKRYKESFTNAHFAAFIINSLMLISHLRIDFTRESKNKGLKVIKQKM